MFALAVFSMSSFVACKDYDDSAYDDVKARLNQEITLREALQRQVDALEAYVKTIKSCQCDLEKALKDYLTKDEAAKTYVTIDNYNTAIALLQKSISEINEKITIINNTLGNVDLSKGTVAEQLANLNQLILNVQALAEKAMALAEQNQEDISKLKKAVEELQGQYIELDKRLTELEKKAAELEANYTALEARVTINEGDIRNIYNILNNIIIPDIPDLSKYVTKEELEAAKQEALAAAADAKALAQQAWDKAIEAYNLANQANTTANNALDKANDAMDKANENAGRIDALEAKVAEIEAKFKDWLTKDEFNDWVTNTYNVKIAEIEGRLDAIEDRLDVLETTVDKLKQDVLKSMITGIIIQAAESPVIGYLNTPLDVRSNILAAYYGEVTSAVHFPSVDAGDYVDMDMFWPNPARNMEVMGINPSDADGNLDISGRFVSQKNGSETGNAGTLYLTINPNTVSFEGVTLGMESSKGAASPITLSPLAYSDRELTFGYTRSADNGFYEAQATLAAGDIDAAKMKIDYTTLESEAKDIIKNKNKASVLTFGAALMNSVKDVMPAYGVKASWTDTAGDGVEHNLFSEYSLATTAIKPLSYAFLKGFKANLPGEGKIRNLLNQLVDKINVNINLNLPDFAKYKGSITFKDITLPTIADNTFRITYTKTYTAADLAGYGELYGDTDETQLYFLVTNKKDGRYALVSTAADGSAQQLYIYDPVTHTYHLATAAEQAAWGAIEFGLTVDVDINKTPEIKDALQDVIDSLNNEFGASSDLAKTITDLLNDVAKLDGLQDQINDAIINTKNDIKTELSKLVSRVYNKLNSIFSKYPNAALQPVLVAKTGDKVKLLSRTKANPTTVSGSLTLYPTSYSLELLAPAYKKFVAVTNVFNADGSEAAASIGVAANQGQNMLKVIDSEKSCTLSGQAGYIYEITYSAVDYHGKVVAKRFYVKF